MVEDEILRLKEVADYLQLTEQTLYRLTHDGKLSGFKVGNARLFRLRDVEPWIEIPDGEGPTWRGDVDDEAE
jgi:excisionase family DNA binding protein